MNDIFIHSSAIVESSQIGDGTRVWAFTHIMPAVSIGADCNIGENCYLESGCAVGKNVTIKNGNMLWEGITLCDGVFVGPNVLFTNDLYPRSPRLPQAASRYKSKSWLKPTLVKEGASLGAGAVVLPGVTIGEFATVGAGAVVTKNVPAYSVVTGNEACVKGWVCQCGLPLYFQDRMATCGGCGRRYTIEENIVRPVSA